MIWDVLGVGVGLGVLLWSANWFVDGAAAIARRYRVAPFWIGMVIVGFGTSAPEMLVSVWGAYEGKGGIALGNVVGSNITNIALILGLTVCLRPIAVAGRVVRVELPLLLAVAVVSAGLLWDGHLGRGDAGMLLGVFGVLMGWSVWVARREAQGAGLDLGGSVSLDGSQVRRAWGRLAVGLVALLVSARVLVWGAESLALRMGMSELFIGLTVVALGTSLPELAASIAAARRGENEIALGNILGSNLFNSLAVIGVAGLVRPLEASPEILHRDLITQCVVTFALLLFALGWRQPGRLQRWEGAALLGGYLSYLVVLWKAG